MNDIYDIIKKARPNISKSSIDIYIKNVNKIKKDLNLKEDDDLFDIEKVFDYINKKTSKTTQRNYLTSVIVYLDSIYKDLIEDEDDLKEVMEAYREELQNSNIEINKDLMNGELSKKQQEKIKTLDELNNKKNLLDEELNNMTEKQLSKHTTKKKLINNLIAHLYLDLPPTRLDYSNMYIKKDETNLDKQKNYLILKNNKPSHFIMNEYKTNKVNGKIKIDIPEQLKVILERYLKYHDKDYLLSNSRGDRMSENSLGQRLSKILDTNLNVLRMIYVSNNIPREMIEKSKEMSRIMGHSMNTQQNIYSKNIK